MTVQARYEPVAPDIVAPAAVDDDSFASSRARMTAVLTIIHLVIYFSFMLLVGAARPLLTQQVVPGLSLGMILAFGVIASSWLLTWFYVQWANRRSVTPRS